MNIEVIAKLQELMAYIQNGARTLKLEAPTPLTPAQLRIFKIDYTSIPNFFHTPQFLNTNKPQYAAFVSQILDFYIFIIPNKLLEVIMAQKPDAYLITKANALKTVLEETGANSLARYLGPDYFPQMVNDSLIYKKILLFEWLFNKIIQYLDQGIIEDVSILGIGPRSEINKRLDAAKLFLTDYSKVNPQVIPQIKQFRESYGTQELINSFSSAIAALTNTPTQDKAKESFAPIPILGDEKINVNITTTSHAPEQTAAKPIQKIHITPNPSPLWNQFFYQHTIGTEILPENEIETAPDPIDLQNDLQTLRLNNYLNTNQKNRWQAYFEKENLDFEKNKLSLLKEAACEYHAYLKTLLEKNNFNFTYKTAVLKKLKVTKQMIRAESVIHFKCIYTDSKKILEQNRDKSTMIFLKILATILSGFTAVLFGLWSVKAEKTTAKLDGIFKLRPVK